MEEFYFYQLQEEVWSADNLATSVKQKRDRQLNI